MKGSGYVHVLLDRDPVGPDGQEICGHCKLFSPEGLEWWENFLNGEFVESNAPECPGYYYVELRLKSGTPASYAILYARTALRRKGAVWEDKKLGSKVVRRWSVPLPVGQVMPFFGPEDFLRGKGAGCRPSK